MGTATSKQEETEKKTENNAESSDVNTPTDEEQNEYKGDNQDGKEPVAEEEIVPMDGIQVRSFLSAPVICPPGYRMDAKGKCRMVQ